jgi:RecB family exonuclease
VRFVDARAARFADARIMWILGVVEGEWPPPARRSIFYPASLLRDLGFAGDQDRQAAARAGFHDLLAAAHTRVAVSVFQLEDDAIVRPSVFVEELHEAPLPHLVDEASEGSASAPASSEGSAGVFDALAERAAEKDASRAARRSWLMLRSQRTDRHESRFHGEVGESGVPGLTVTQADRYLECPFRYFAAHVLRLEEEPEREEVGLDPRRRGSVVHEVFRAFFEHWSGSGRGNITPGNLDEARAHIAAVVEDSLASLGEEDRDIERTRLLGSAALPGLAERVFRLEAVRPERVVARLLEFDLGGTYTFGRERPRTVALRGVADRIDLLADGTFRILDYKTGRPPDVRRAIQLGIYALCAERKLEGHLQRGWRVAQAAYVSFADPRPWVSVLEDAGNREVLDEAADRFASAVEGIARGAFPPAPASRRLCVTCGFARVCRKEYVGEIA